MKLVWILLIVSTLLCVSCSKPQVVTQTTFVYLYPEKIPVPSKPSLYTYKTDESITSTTNFKRLQQNTVFLVDYANALRDVITQYEVQIDEFAALKEAQINKAVSKAVSDETKK